MNRKLRLLSVDPCDADLNPIGHELLQLTLRDIRFEFQQQLFACAAGEYQRHSPASLQVVVTQP